jgi:ABC-type sugar transport system substrate-binding protein
MAAGGTAGTPWQTGQGVVMQAIAHKEGWQSVILSNNGQDPSTALSNVQTFIQDRCSVVIEGPVPETTDPVMAAKLAAAKIPVITFDIAVKGWYFVGISNLQAGITGGKALGAILKSKWNCNVSEIVASGLPVVGVIDTERTGGMVTGVRDVCPNIPASDSDEYNGDGQISTALPVARALLAANPTWTHIAAVGINDDGVDGTLEAAQQLGRGSSVIGWGQSGDLDTGPNVNADLAGSVFYFLEGYPEYALPLLKEIAAGHAPKMADNTHNNPAVTIPVCSASTAQAKNIPDYGTRLKKMIEVKPGVTEQSLYCPKV